MAFEIKESRAFRPVHEKKKHEEMNESLYNSEDYTIQKNCIIISYNCIRIHAEEKKICICTSTKKR